jgi:AcrR family transcriptional regulator
MGAKDPRQRLLDRALDHVAANGIGDTSLRALAAALGTSHRMLIHHFGSKEGLWVEIAKTVERRERALLSEMLRDSRERPAGALREWWRHISDRSLWPNERLFFELYGQALQGRPHAVALLDGVVDTWVDAIAEVGAAWGMPPDMARAHARLGVAISRGLLLDLLATGDTAGVDGAMEAFIDVYVTWLEHATPPPPPLPLEG